MCANSLFRYRCSANIPCNSCVLSCFILSFEKPNQRFSRKNFLGLFRCITNMGICFSGFGISNYKQCCVVNRFGGFYCCHTHVGSVSASQPAAI